MNTIATAPSPSTAILATAVGKYKGIGWFREPATGEYGFATFEITRTEKRSLLPAGGLPGLFS
jgi:hypothetical protein